MVKPGEFQLCFTMVTVSETFMYEIQKTTLPRAVLHQICIWEGSNEIYNMDIYTLTYIYLIIHVYLYTS